MKITFNFGLGTINLSMYAPVYVFRFLKYSKIEINYLRFKIEISYALEPFKSCF